MILSLLVVTVALAAPPDGQSWCDFYRAGFPLGDVAVWQSPLTRSARTAEGLRITDLSTDKGSGRFYYVNWRVDPQRGATVEARLKVASCSAAWGVSLLVADGVHEEGVTFFPERVLLAAAGTSAPFAAAGQFHTYRVRIQGTDIQVWADDKLLIDGQGKFTAPAHALRNQVGFGAASSNATGEAIWESVRFAGGRLESAPQITAPHAPGLEIQLGPTQIIAPGAIYQSMFKLADGELIVGNRRSSDAGRTWQSGRALHAGAYQFPDGQIVQLPLPTWRTRVRLRNTGSATLLDPPEESLS